MKQLWSISFWLYLGLPVSNSPIEISSDTTLVKISIKLPDQWQQFISPHKPSALGMVDGKVRWVVGVSAFGNWSVKLYSD